MSGDANNPILKEDVPHYFKIYILRWGSWLLRNNHVNNKKPFQTCAANLWYGNHIGTDDEDNYSESCISDYAREILLSELRSFVNNTKLNQITFDENWSRIEHYRGNIEDYCNYLIKERDEWKRKYEETLQLP